MLNNKELEEGLAISVHISNPERKKERTDTGANDREVYVAGLSKFVTKPDLEKLFGTVCHPKCKLSKGVLTHPFIWSKVWKS